MTNTNKINFVMLNNLFNILIFLLMALLPFIWSKQINGNYFNAKMFLFYFISGLCALSLTFNKTNSFRFKLNPYLFFGLSFFIFFLVFYQFIFGLQNHALSFLYGFKALSFCCVSYYLYRSKVLSDFLTDSSHRKYLCYFISAVIGSMAIFHAYEIYDFRFIQDTLEHGRILGTFGNVNMLSEFFVLFLPLIYFWVHLDIQPKTDFKIQFKIRNLSKTHSFIKYMAFILWMFVVIYTRSRSSWIGLSLFCIYILFKNRNIKDLISICLAISMYLICLWLPTSVKSDFEATKKSSFSERLSLYKGTVELIRDNPLGFGLGAFTNEVIPYRLKQDFKPYEFEYADQPHSEILKWGVQYGWLGLFLCLSFLMYLFISIVKLKDDLLLGGFLVLVPQLLFQFPFENPASLLVISIYLALCLRKAFEKNQKIVDSKLTSPYGLKAKISFLVLSFILISNSVLFITAIIVESQFSEDLDKTSLMCKIYPINQRNCNYKNVSILQKGQTALFRSDFKSEINLYYLTSDMQRVLPMYFQKMNDEKHLCENVLIYQMMYPTQKHFNQNDVKLCSKYPPPFQFESPKQFRADYRNWMEKAVF